MKEIVSSSGSKNLYTFSKPVSNFLMLETALSKHDMVGNQKVINANVHNFNESNGFKLFSDLHEELIETSKSTNDNVLEEVAQNVISDTELMDFCDIFENIPPVDFQDENPFLPNSVSKEIYEDFDKLEKETKYFVNPSIKIVYKKRITKTYSKWKLEKQNKYKNNDETSPSKLCLSNTQNIDIPVSQPISENLLKLTSYFLSKNISDSQTSITYNENLKNLEEIKIDLNLQNIFFRRNALFYGDLFNYEDSRGVQTEQPVFRDFREKDLKDDRIKEDLLFSHKISERRKSQPSSTKSYIESLDHNKLDFANSLKQPLQNKRKSLTIFKKKSLPEFSNDNNMENVELEIKKTEIPHSATTKVLRRRTLNIHPQCNSTKNTNINISPKTEIVKPKVTNYKHSKKKSQNNLSCNLNDSIESISNLTQGLSGFITASNKIIHISEDSLTKAKKLVESTEKTLL